MMSLKMTKTEVEKAVEERNITYINLKISRYDKEPVRRPGTVGICETKNGRLMVYMVDDKGRMYNTSVHKSRREANGRVYQRVMAQHQALQEKDRLTQPDNIGYDRMKEEFVEMFDKLA